MRTYFKGSTTILAFLLALSFLGMTPSHAQKLSFQPMYYPKGETGLDSASKAALKRVVQMLKVNPKTTLMVEGHASVTKGSTVDPQAVSQKRVDAAYGFLLSEAKTHKVPLVRIEAEAFGISRLAQDKDATSPRNDRIEFKFRSSDQLSEANKKGLETVKVIYWNTLYHCLFQIGVTHGTFEKEGLNIQLVATNHSSVNQVCAICGLEPFIEYGRSVFAGGVCGGSPHLAVASGVDMVVIGGMLAGGSMLIAKPKTAAKLRANPKNFKGITIGRPVGTSITSMIVSGFLKRHGLDWRKDVKWKIYDSHEDVIVGIVKGEVDAGDTYAPLHIRAQKEHGIVTVYNTVELFPYHPCCRVIALRARIKDERPKYVRFLRGLINAHKLFVQKPRVAMETVRRYTGYTKDEVMALTHPNFLLNPDPLMNGLVRFWGMVNDTGYVKSKADIRDYVDNSIYFDALMGLRKDFPTDPYYKYMEQQYMLHNAAPKKLSKR